MWKRHLALGLAGVVFSAAPGWGQGRSETRTMDFDACLATIRGMASRFAQAPVNLVETGDLRIVRFIADDGSVLVTCSRLDRKMVVVQSPG